MYVTNRFNVGRIDRQIRILLKEFGQPETTKEREIEIKDKLESLLTYRNDIYEAKKTSVAPEIVSGLFGLGAVVLVLYYEKTDIVTSKAFGVATKLLRG